MFAAAPDLTNSPNSLCSQDCGSQLQTSMLTGESVFQSVRLAQYANAIRRAWWTSCTLSTFLGDQPPKATKKPGKQTLLVAVALAGFTYAQAKDIPDSERLDVVFGPRPIHAPGALMHPGHMSNIPDISTPAWDPSTPSALLFMVDLDWPLDNQRVSRLHWLVTGLTLSSTTPPSGREQYRSFEYPRPAGGAVHAACASCLGNGDSFDDDDGTLVAAETRAPFVVSQFLLDCGLDEAHVLARNHVRVRNLAGHPTTTFPPARQATGTLEDAVSEESAGSRQLAATTTTGGAGSLGYARGTAFWAIVMISVSVVFAAIIL
ncbi:hypothetical protein BU25DRAFT_425223 [Macroventuria anomochaeta]|uniref:Uncharacterized protein n=1 Tax=Macroventuria anomochaeta TaxID=301207 RepID=A0ACB6RLZ4_9PLEO|nr:uncharacterized protein BU25DRAFT_425223 [Macroventuria anomochaeta]KAF2622965.1 hypothetical protein BU25DRAFT_425223 [Macroventuria anomochaeta]